MVSLTPGQKASISPEAADFLAKVKHLPLANYISSFVTMPGQVPKIRQGMAEKMEPGEAALIEKHNLKTTDIAIAGVPVILIEPPAIKPEKQNKILLNLYGGAFIMGSARDRCALTMAVELGVRVYSVDYAKSPEAKYPKARDQVLAVYTELIKRGPPGGSPISPSDIFCMGSSSGGQLIVSMLLLAKRKGLPMPTGGLYLCTPAMDLTGAGDSMVSNSDRDIMPVSLLMGMVSQNYPAPGLDLKDPLYSPIYADYDSSFPPTVITTGTRDFALSHGVRFYWKLREAGVKVELLIGEGMWHGFNWDPLIPESIQTRAAVVKFLEAGL
ncbi:hypothetical protein F53441_14072 [Fusarium austroafricanum]|uniref:Alpha/beta hydrolase fold-3 domain-containing protein n=1 Tax=Fusarium austroafricanum TaxID=2364996 RepID=A0A8H4NCK3_9HYPO|nr:hypothetical protein F53441_14072 [Fusarium austroafricanum]